MRCALAALLLLIGSTSTRAQNLLQIAVVVDTSQSMRRFAPAVVEELRGYTIFEGRDDWVVEMALVTYGGDEGVRTLAPFTRDLDPLLLEKLPAALAHLEGGSEPCGRVLRHAVETLGWSRGRLGFNRMIVIVGNESFDQRGSNPDDPTGTAMARQLRGRRSEHSIQLHTLYCGPQAEGRRSKWDHGLDFRYYDFDTGTFRQAPSRAVREPPGAD